MPGLLATALPGHRADNGEHQSRFKLCFWAREQWPFHSKSGIWLTPTLALPQVDLVRQAGTERAECCAGVPAAVRGAKRTRGRSIHEVLSPGDRGPKQWQPALSVGTFLQQYSVLTHWQEESFTKRPGVILSSSYFCFLLKCSYRFLASRNNLVFLETLHRYMLT